MVRHLRLAALAIASVAASASWAQAQPSVRLTYDVADLDACPEEAELRALVASRIGGVPYSEDGAWEVRVMVRAVSTGLEATVRLVDPDGLDRGQHSLMSDGDCRALISSVALTLSLVHEVVRDDAAQRSGDTTTPVAQPVVETESGSHAEPYAAEAPAAPLPPPQPGSHWWLGLGPVMGYGLQPGVSVGLRAVGGVGGGHALARLGLRVDLPRPLNEGTPTIRLGWMITSLAVCGRYRALLACGVGRIALAYVPATGTPRVQATRSIGGGVGAELGLRLWEHPRAMLQVHAGFSVPLVRTRVTVDGELLFRERPLDMTVGVALLWGRP